MKKRTGIFMMIMVVALLSACSNMLVKAPDAPSEKKQEDIVLTPDVTAAVPNQEDGGFEQEADALIEIDETAAIKIAIEYAQNEGFHVTPEQYEVEAEKISENDGEFWSVILTEIETADGFEFPWQQKYWVRMGVFSGEVDYFSGSR